MTSKKIYIDVETTGLNPDEHGIIQIAGIIEIDDKIEKSFNLRSNIHKDDAFDPKALEVIGKTIEQIHEFPDAVSVHQQFCEIMQEFVDKYDSKDKFSFIAYNAGFDMDFLRSWFGKCGDKYFGSWFWFPYIDVMTLAYNSLLKERPEMTNFKLGTVADKMGLELEKTKLHDALYDVKLAMMLYKQFEKY